MRGRAAAPRRAVWSAAGLLVALVSALLIAHASTRGPVAAPVTTPTTAPVPTPAPTSAPAPETPAVPAEPDGVAVGFSLSELVGEGAPRRAALLDAAQDAGANAVRIDVSWATVQPHDAAGWEWEVVDAAVRDVRDRDLGLIAVVGYTPQWASDPGCTDVTCPPVDPSAFAAFASAAVDRYRSVDVLAWEVWNEPNAAYWTPSPDPVRYADLLRRTSLAVHERDPGAVVLLGGLAPTTTGPEGHLTPADFLAAVYAAQGGGTFDGVAVHPYAFPALPGEVHAWSGWQQMLDVRALMVTAGDGAKGVWATELGAPTTGDGPIATLADRRYDAHPDHVDADLQAATAAAVFQQQAQLPWLRALVWYSLVDLPEQDGPANVSGYGLLRTDGTPKPALDAWRSAAAPLLAAWRTARR